MTRRIAPLVVSLALAGCYASHRVPTPSPCDDPEFDADTALDLPFDADGVLVGEGFRDDRFQSVPGWAPSISDDGRWLVTAYFRDGHDGNLTGVLSDLASGGAREWALHSNLSVPSISGDGSTLIYVQSGEAADVGLTVVDRATLEERLSTRGAISPGFFSRAPTISDDGRRAVLWLNDTPPGARGVVVDLETGEREPLADPRGAYIYGGEISGDGRSVTYWSFADLDDWYPAEAVIAGPAGVQALRGVAGFDSISDDGCEFVAATNTVPYSGGTPILGLALFVGGRRVALGPEGEPNIWLSYVVLSGDGGTAVMIMANAERLAMLVRIRLADGHVETQDLGDCSVNGLAVSDDGAVIAVDVFRCDESVEPNEHTRIFRPGVW